MDKPDLASHARFGQKDKRLAAREEVNRVVAAWVAANDHHAVLSACAEAGAPASLIYSIADIFQDPQYRARQNIKMADSRELLGAPSPPGRHRHLSVAASPSCRLADCCLRYLQQNFRERDADECLQHLK